MRPVCSLLLVSAALASVLLPAASASALSYPVTSTADTDGKGTLRGSIEEANANTGADSIPIQVTGTIELESALPPIEGATSISGPGSRLLTVSRSASAPDFRIFTIGPSISASIQGLTVTAGVSSVGGGISSTSPLTLDNVVVTGNEAKDIGGVVAYARGGGVFSSFPLTVRESMVRGNKVIARGGSDESAGAGGGIFTTRELTVDRSTIAENVVEALGEGKGYALASGGGVKANGSTVIERSTISGNSVLAVEGVTLMTASGGGLEGSVELTSSTVTGNSATGDGSDQGANLNLGPVSLVRNSIVAEPLGDAGSCKEPLSSGGFNLDEDGSCGFGEGSDLAGVAAGLDPVLRDNGGPTPTHALLSGSIAIDRGNSFGETTDQRGLPRPSDFPAISDREGGDGSDIGAFELQAPPPAPAPASPILVQAVPGDRTPPNTRIVSGPARVGFERLAKFRFNSSEGQSSFRCKLDKKRWKRCTSPYKKTVKPGKHLFKVRAIDRFGNADPSPARFGWRVKPLS